MSCCIMCRRDETQTPLRSIGTEWIGDSEDESEWEFFLCEACALTIVNEFKERERDQPR